MKRELSDATEAAVAAEAAVQSQLTDSSPPDTTGRTDCADESTGPESNGSVQNPPIADARVRFVNSNGLVVYTRNKRLKRAADGGGLVNSGESMVECEGKVAVTSADELVTLRSGAAEQNGEAVDMENSEGLSELMHEHDDIRKLSGKGENGSVSAGKLVNGEHREGEGQSMVEVKVTSAEYLVPSRKHNDANITKPSGEAVNGSVSEGTFVIKESGGGEGKSEMVEVEVKEQANAIETRSSSLRRLRRPTFKLREENNDRENGDDEGFRDAVVMEAEEVENMTGTPTKKLEMKMSKKIEIKGRPNTVIELFETGLLEGYPVFYNGGKKGILLRGTIKDIGILCFCNFCQGAKVIPPSQFEIHAVKTYKRASQYICLENGKSLLDVVKECRKFSLKALEEAIKNFIGPEPAKESIVCRSCKESFLATSAAMDQVCDACVIHIRRETNAIQTWRDTKSICGNYVKARSLEALGSDLSLESSGSADVHTTPKRKGRGRRKRKFSELSSDKESLDRSSLQIAARKKSQLEIMEKFPKPALVPKAVESVSVHKLLKNNSLEKTSNRSPISVSTPYSSRNASTYAYALSNAQWKIIKKDQKMHQLIFEEGGLPDGTELAYYARGKKLLDGYKQGEGIFCFCCNSEVSPSQFEAHAGWASRRKPYGYIYTSNGVSLHEFAISLLKGRKYSAKENDDLCVICADGGKLVHCDGCPRAFHKECASLSNKPRDKWYCTYCQNAFHREKYAEHNANAVAGGRISGVDPIEQITNRCIRIVKNPEEAEVVACVICRGYDFSKSGFGPRTVILCDQCEREYHVGCLKKSKMADLKELPKGIWFCSMECKSICCELQTLLNSGEEKLPDSCLDVIKKKHQCEGLATNIDFDVRWRLLSGKMTSKETRLLLSEAVAIFHDCFDPIIDSATGRDFIPSMVYGRNIRGQDFSGMYCAILTVNSSVVSAGILRIFGQDMAELPLVATRIGNQGKGYFQLLFSCIENLLASLNVRSFVLPAANGAESIWTNKFGFRKIPQEQLINFKKTCWQMITFRGTSMLGKMVPKCQIISQEDADVVK